MANGEPQGSAEALPVEFHDATKSYPGADRRPSTS